MTKGKKKGVEVIGVSKNQTVYEHLDHGKVFGLYSKVAGMSLKSFKQKRDKILFMF